MRPVFCDLFVFSLKKVSKIVHFFYTHLGCFQNLFGTVILYATWAFRRLRLNPQSDNPPASGRNKISHFRALKRSRCRQSFLFFVTCSVACIFLSASKKKKASVARSRRKSEAIVERKEKKRKSKDASCATRKITKPLKGVQKICHFSAPLHPESGGPTIFFVKKIEKK